MGGAACACAAANQAWNCAMGLVASSAARCRPPAASDWVNWAARVFWALPAGATGGGEGGR